MLDRNFFERHPVVCARDLIGAHFLWGNVGGIIVETEAYTAEGDEACHTFFRPSSRRFIGDHEAGSAYIYLNYGMYWLVNLLIKGGDMEGFVLFRALEPRSGIDVMRQRRHRYRITELCSGPGKLSIALGMNGSHHGQSLISSLTLNPPAAPIDESPRIGISRAQHLHWRFTLRGNPHLSARVPELSMRRDSLEEPSQ